MTTFNVHIGDCREVLKTLPDDSVHCCVTSPPYWRLRDYGVAGQLGSEDTPEEYLDNLVGVFREVRRVLRPDGTLWVNLGDSYAGKPGGGQGKNGERATRSFTASIPAKRGANLKPKDLVGMPWRLAFALQDDGWWLRADIIWSKPNCMPESVTDRPTKSHEYLFLLTKSDRYLYDAEAIKEPISPKTLTVNTTPRKGTGTESTGEKLNAWMEANGGRYHPTARNKRSVWTVASVPFDDAHFATFPPRLIEPCIAAGTSAKGCCPTCGTPWERVLERTSVKPVDYEGKWSHTDPQSSGRRLLANVRARRAAGGDHDNPFPAPRTVGWRQGCECPAQESIPCTVLDPFHGTGTTGQVSLELGRSYVGIELNPAYVEMGKKRTAVVQPLLLTR